MRVLIVALLFGAVISSGCATRQVSGGESWVSQARAQAEAGTMKWSDFYKMGFAHFSAEPESFTKGQHMTLMNELIGAAIAFEQGVITKDRFEELQRAADIQGVAILDGQSELARAAWAAALQSLGNAYKQNADMYQQRVLTAPGYMPPAKCITQSLGGGKFRTICQ